MLAPEDEGIAAWGNYHQKTASHSKRLEFLRLCLFSGRYEMKCLNLIYIMFTENDFLS
jgi:hypothetical protein